jgi:hypothetical protein
MTENDRSKMDKFNGQYFIPEGKIHAVVLMGPGLNLNPLKMLPLAFALLEKSYAVCLINLEQSSKDDLDSHWEQSTVKLLNKLPTSCKNKPLVTLGFSLAVLHFLDLTDKEVIRPQLMISLAPPFCFAKILSPIKLIPMIPFNMKFFSLNFSDYRYRICTSVKEYRALIKLQNKKLENSIRVRNIPHLIYLSKKDELLSYKNIEKIVFEHKEWTLKEIIRSPKIKFGFNHLIIDEQTIGQKEFEEILDGIDRFIKKHLTMRNNDTSFLSI